MILITTWSTASIVSQFITLLVSIFIAIACRSFDPTAHTCGTHPDMPLIRDETLKLIEASWVKLHGMGEFNAGVTGANLKSKIESKFSNARANRKKYVYTRLETANSRLDYLNPSMSCIWTQTCFIVCESWMQGWSRHCEKPAKRTQKYPNQRFWQKMRRHTEKSLCFQIVVGQIRSVRRTDARFYRN